VLELDRFLQSVEKRAFCMANMALQNEADALDVVQDSMIKLASNYGHLTVDDWPPLFFTILENRIKDFYRKERTWKRFFQVGHKKPKECDDLDAALEETVEDVTQINPEHAVHLMQSSDQAMKSIETLPLKQQQCFLLRCWEGFSVKETAQVMGISEGSVKTHYHRAVQKIQMALNLDAPAGQNQSNENQQDKGVL